MKPVSVNVIVHDLIVILNHLTPQIARWKKEEFERIGKRYEMESTSSRVFSFFYFFLFLFFRRFSDIHA